MNVELLLSLIAHNVLGTRGKLLLRLRKLRYKHYFLV